MSQTSDRSGSALIIEQARLHRLAGPTSAGAGAILALVLVGLVWRADLAARWFGALAVLGAAQSLRLMLAWQDGRAGPDRRPASTWLQRYRLSAALHGVAWATFATVLLPVLDAHGRTLLLYAQSALCAGALIATSFDGVAALLFVVPAGAPLLVALARRTDPDLPSGAVLVVSLGVIALIGIARSRGALLDAIDDHLAEVGRADAARRDAEAAASTARELSEQRQLLESLMQTSQQGYWIVDTAGVTLDLNASMCRLLGRTRDEVMGRVALEFFEGQDLQTLSQQIEQRRRGVAGAYEIRIRRPDGARVYCQNNATPIYDAAGQPAGSVGVWTDITERHEHEAALHTYAQVVNSLDDMVSVVNEDTTYRLVNTAWCQRTGWTREAAIGRSTVAVMPWAHADERTTAFRECLVHQQPRTVSQWTQLPGVGSRYIETTYRPYADAAAPSRSVVIVSRDATEREQARQQLAASGEYLRRTLNATGDAIFAAESVQPDAVVPFANEQMLQMWGIPAERAPTLTSGDIMAHAMTLFVDPAAESRRVADIIAANRTSETRVLLRDGRTLLRRCIPAQVGSHRLRVWSFRDVTAEEQALRLAHASQAEQRALLDAFPGFIGRIDTSMTYTYVNVRLAEALGTTPDALVGRSLSSIYGATIGAQLSTQIQRAMAGEEVVFDSRFERPGGQRPMTVQTTLARGSDPRTGAPAVYGFSVDISDAKRAEQALRASAAELRALLDAFPGYIVAIDKDLRYTYVNGKSATLFGREASAFIGQRAQDILEPGQFARVQTEIRRAWQGLQPVTDLHYPAEVDRARLDLEMTHVAGPLQPGGAQTCYSFGVDVTARKIAEEALVVARDEAQQANRAKSHFLSQMSHELRTPLNAILGLGQLLASDEAAPLPPVKRGYVDQMLHGARHLLELINEVLDLGRIESGQLQLEANSVALTALVAECLDLVRPLALERDVQLPELSPSSGGLCVLADRTRLKQVLLNLLGNAIKYNRSPGAVTLEWATEGPWARIGVRDTGRGLTAKELARLFQPFERLGATHTAIEGTGIGLALSLRLTEAMGGTIGADSQPGVGSLFWLQLPLAAASHAAALPAPVAARRDLPAHPSSPPAHAPTVLYIEDNEVNAFVMEAMFQRLPGVALLTASTPVVGLQLAHDERPDLILLDMQLPEMSGLEVLARLRAHDLTHAIPVIVVSADAMPEQIHTALAAGAMAYLTKPILLEELLSTLHRVLSPMGYTVDTSVR